MNGSPLLAVHGLTKRFGGLVAVKDIGFDIRPGEILGLIGPNGSGKSTVMKLIMGIERPNAGSVKVDGARWRAGRRTGSRARAWVSCSSIRGRSTGRRCSNISSSRFCRIRS